MVGVPGRSKGCHACRDLKIACSQEKPECLICLRASRKCPGYQRERIFVNQTSFDGPTSGRYRKQKPKNPRKRKQSFHDPNPFLSSKRKSEHDLEQLQTGSFTLNAVSLSYSQSFAVTATRQHFLAGFYSRSQTTSWYSPISTGHWLQLLPQMTIRSPALESFALAFSTARLGHHSNDGDLVKSSLRLYTTGLRELQRALWDPKAMYDDQTLGACILCAMYEVFQCPDQSPQAYESHLEGCSKLIQARGAAAHTKGLGHAMFIAFRLIGTLQALVHKTTFLAKPEWRVIPFALIPKTPISELVDVLLEALPLMEQGERLKYIPEPTALFHEAVDLLQSCWNLDYRRIAFYKKFEASIAPMPLYYAGGTSMPCSFTSPASLDPDVESMLASTRYTFQDIRIAQIMVLFWSITAMLHSGMHRLNQLVNSLSSVYIDGQMLGEKIVVSDLTHSQRLEEFSASFNTPFDTDSVLNKVELSNGVATQDFGSEIDANSAAEESFGTASQPHTPGIFISPPAILPTINHVLASVHYCLFSTEVRSLYRDLGMSLTVAPLRIILDVLKEWSSEIPECKAKANLVEKILQEEVWDQGRGVRIVKYS